MFVALKSNHSDDEFLSGLRLTPAFEERDGVMYKDGSEICTKMNKKFYSTSSIEGEQYVVLVDDLSEVDEMLESGVYDSIRYGALLYNCLACGGVNNTVVPPIILLSETSIPNFDNNSLVSTSVL